MNLGVESRLELVKSDVAREDYCFYSVMAARDTAGREMPLQSAADEPSTTGSGRVLTGAKGAGIGHRPD